jgi:hypothetical protein
MWARPFALAVTSKKTLRPSLRLVGVADAGDERLWIHAVLNEAGNQSLCTRGEPFLEANLMVNAEPSPRNSTPSIRFSITPCDVPCHSLVVKSLKGASG